MHVFQWFASSLSSCNYFLPNCTLSCREIVKIFEKRRKDGVGHWGFNVKKRIPKKLAEVNELRLRASLVSPQSKEMWTCNLLLPYLRARNLDFSNK